MDNEKYMDILLGIQNQITEINNNFITINNNFIAINNEIITIKAEIKEIKEVQQKQENQIQEIKAELKEIKDEQQKMKKEFKRELRQTERRIIDMHKRDLYDLKRYIDIIAKEVQRHGKFLAV